MTFAPRGFALKKKLVTSRKAMVFAWLVMALFLFSAPAAQAQFSILPSNPQPAPVKPVIKAPREPREAATKGNFPRRLKKEEIEALFMIGQPFEARGLGAKINFTVTLFPNGTAKRIDRNDNKEQAGKWRWLGDGYCSTWAGSREGCFTVVKDGDIFKVVRFTRAVAFWKLPVGVKAEKPIALPPAAPLPKKQASKKR